MLSKNVKRIISAFILCLLTAAVCSYAFAMTPWQYVDSIYDFEDEGRYNDAVENLKKIIENESYFTDPNVVSAAKGKLKHYEYDISLFTETSDSICYTGALHEPKIGLYHATCGAHYDFDTLTLTYSGYEHEFKQAREEKKGLLYAFNVNEGASIRTQDFSADAMEICRVANKYPDVPLFVRFGAEMNIWTDMATPQEYITAFRSVASIVKENCKHAAMVWSLNYVSHAGVNYMDYYPGDEYVDWVGMCFYADMYQGGTKYEGQSAFLNRINDTQYYKGDAADPVIPLRELCDIFSGKKPVLIAESGASRSVNIGNMAGTNTIEYAKSGLRKIYEYLPMCCPEIKLIAHFNTDMPGEVGSYRITGYDELEKLYTELGTRKHFLKSFDEQSDAVAYEKLESGFKVTEPTLAVSSYVKTFGHYEPSVEYLIDGISVANVTNIPYRTTLDFSGLANGEHILKIVAKDNGKEVWSKDFAFTLAIPRIGDKINDVLSTDIVALINGTPIKSFNIDGNTAVVAEDLSEYGFDVKWDGKARTLSVGKGNGKITASYVPIKSDSIGIPVMDVCFTDIKTYIEGNEVAGFNVGGLTIIYFDELAKYGDVKWNGIDRIISLSYN